ncbi:uncharacterized protein [Macrobrachium rosenbergii]|uniref:uncharacterized protein n=1 Tax=Macrobrachium rosenbergii TaxID=79674 RepID=UPI0034D4B9F4
MNHAELDAVPIYICELVKSSVKSFVFFPSDPNHSDEDSDEEFENTDVDDDNNDSDYQQYVEAALAEDAVEEENLVSPPRKKRKIAKLGCATPPAAVAEEEWADEEEDEEAGTGSQGATVQRNWVMEDISNPPLPTYAHAGMSTIPTPFLYFSDLFGMELVEHLVYQTNLYARQSDLRTPCKTDTSETLMFLGILIYMGVVHLLSLRTTGPLTQGCHKWQTLCPRRGFSSCEQEFISVITSKLLPLKTGFTRSGQSSLPSRRTSCASLKHLIKV